MNRPNFFIGTMTVSQALKLTIELGKMPRDLTPHELLDGVQWIAKGAIAEFVLEWDHKEKACLFRYTSNFNAQDPFMLVEIVAKLMKGDITKHDVGNPEGLQNLFKTVKISRSPKDWERFKEFGEEVGVDIPILTYTPSP